MKNIAIINPDYIDPDCYFENLTSASKRSLKFFETLSNEESFNVKILLPRRVDTNATNYKSFSFDIENDVDFYNFTAAYLDWSEELDKKLMQYDFVIVQTVSGVGFQNCTVLPNKVNVIVDCWAPFVTQLPVELLSKHRIKRRFHWEKVLPQYKSLLKRANSLICANDKQRYFYEGQLFMIDKLGWDAFKFSPIHKIPFGIDKYSKIETKNFNKFKLLWYGDIHQYTVIKDLIKYIYNNKDIQLDIFYRTNDISIKKDKYSYSKLETDIKDFDNINLVSGEHCLNFEEYNAGIYVSNFWLEDEYSYKNTILEMLSRGLPVITKNVFDEYSEFNFLQNKGIYTINNFSDLNAIAKGERELIFDNDHFKELHVKYSWKNITAPLIDYIENFNKKIDEEGSNESKFTN